mmetsp:Transcript_35398/g.53223  ORF Transcript_35398/g.53223 Transcript_35398/m.53223 type:complete len:239 (-) Transcript_35398:182-898(-)|eukprot:CAMPEP_0206493712 /NCGR_PEP_ID=MMETSP0324_2-20121206/47193_1 /ASSEMBLY_ACC=CAM_ASM_000836 /TAXON_ID=2866 /ORGANISM="Crypthecodinium cohnii, Strain Seligo" /LENGTH=238 /DNA_ID=CAMNT_0053977023 /DNA_START=72 /DNA_END=788 /DNA_ORIENTATION=+
MPLDLPSLTVRNAAAWSQWLRSNAPTSVGVWLTLAKKGTTSPTSLTYPEALDEALCNGWIDGQKRKLDEKTFVQRFTPRTAKSAWSKINVGHIARLKTESRMKPLGLQAVEAAKADGRWHAAYAGQATAELPPDFLAAVAAVPEAQAKWDRLEKQHRYAVYLRLTVLKTQSKREQQISACVDMLASGQTPYQKNQKPQPPKPKPAVRKRPAARVATEESKVPKKVAVKKTENKKKTKA